MIFNFEKKALDFLNKNIYYLVWIAVILISIIIRYAMRDFLTSDATTYLIPWFDTLKANGGISGLATPIEGCNYNFPYQFLIALMTYLPIEPLYSYKLLSCIFDYLLASAVSYFVFGLAKENKNQKGLIAFAATICSPLVFVNSSAWAQCDSIYCFWLVLALIFISKENYLKSFIFLGIAFAFKFQAIFVLPFFLFYYFYKRKFSIIYFFIIPAAMTVLSLPAIVQGRTIIEMFTIYTDNTNAHPSLTNNYPCFWRMLNDGTNADGYQTLKYCAILFTVLALGCLVYFWISKNIQINPMNIITMTFIMTFTTIIFLPSMHERYGYVYEILAIIIAFIYAETIPLLIALTCLSLTTYGIFLYGNAVNEWFLAAINIIIYIGYMIILNKKLLTDADK